MAVTKEIAERQAVGAQDVASDMGVTEPTGRLRWRPRRPSEGLPGLVLEQEFRTITYRLHKAHSATAEWVEVPTVYEA